jgi:transcriptional regulator with PAS, ATPase and Fis domain
MRLQLLRDGTGDRAINKFSTPPPAIFAPTARDRNGHVADVWPPSLARLDALPPFIVASPAMRDLFAKIERASEVAATALITGETGIGKELIARAIHALSPRNARPFIAFNCGEASRELFESRFFGHHRGSFTGAVADHKGIIREAEGGALLLDEIGELSPELQPKLLRFLQESEILPIGASRPIKADVLVIAATNRDLEAEVRAGHFREDLFARLNRLRLRVPPLRERREDIPPLVEHFLERYQQEYGRHGLRLSDEAWGLLLAYDWPGNVRGLASEVMRLVTWAANGEVIGADRLSPEIRAGACSQPAPATAIVEGRIVIDLNQTYPGFLIRPYTKIPSHDNKSLVP